MSELILNGHRIADDAPAYLVAELGHNHAGSVETAASLIRMATACGANAVKLQKRDNATLYTPAMRAQPYAHTHSFGATYGAHRDALELNEAQYVSLRCVAKSAGVDFFATAFDEASAECLMRVGVPAIKIASGGLTDSTLLRHVAGLGVPVILSTGGGGADDIDRAVNLIAPHVPLALLHCTAAYPVRDFGELNLRCIVTLKQRYPELVIGWSGHDSGIAMAMVAYAFGARIIEKHFTSNRANKGTDHAFSIEPSGLRKLRRDLDRAHQALGDGVKKFYPSEYAPISKMRRWLVDGKWQIGTQAEQESGVRV
jgi:N-acetylneuraminate synthase/sialic acid synthase